MQIFWAQVFVQMLTWPAMALCVKSSKANLRTGPSPKHKVSWEAPKYTPLVKMAQQGSWYKVQDQDGETHWVYKSNVTSRFRCLSIKTATANLRTGPGSRHGLGDVRRVDKYTPFKRLDWVEEGWYKVEAPWGARYWVSENLVWRPVKRRRISL